MVVPGGEQDVKVITQQEGRDIKLINQRKNVNEFNNQDGLDTTLTNQRKGQNVEVINQQEGEREGG